LKAISGYLSASVHIICMNIITIVHWDESLLKKWFDLNCQWMEFIQWHLSAKIATFWNGRVKLSLHRYVHALRAAEGWGLRIYRHSAHEGGLRLSALCTGGLYPQEISLSEDKSTSWATVWSEGLSQWKIRMTPLGIKPVIFWLVV
jgi:hypothetical protein